MIESGISGCSRATVDARNDINGDLFGNLYTRQFFISRLRRCIVNNNDVHLNYRIHLLSKDGC